MEYRVLAGILTGMLSGLLLAVWVLVQLRQKVSDPSRIDVILCWLDEKLDEFENPAKRMQVIIAAQSLLGWRRIFLPAFIVGLVLDIVAALLRKTGIPDLHKEETTSVQNPNMKE